MPNTAWFNKRPWMTLPAAIPILTALLKNEFEFSALDANIEELTEEECIDKLKEQGSIDCVIVSALSVEYYKQYHAAVHLAKKVYPECITLMGGVYPTTTGSEALKDLSLDYIMIGHAEGRLVDFITTALLKNIKELREFPGIGYRDTNSTLIINPIKPGLFDINQCVKPDYSSIVMSKYLKLNSKSYAINSQDLCAMLITSYGCPYNCVFCATRTISGHSIVFRPIGDILEEIEFFIHTHGVKNFIFWDDCFLADRKRVIELINNFINRKYNISWKTAAVSAWLLDDDLLENMKKAGCEQITVSVESGSQRVLSEIIRKPLNLDIIEPLVGKCKQLGINIGANFVIGFPGETWDEIRATFAFAEKCNFDIVQFYIATPLPNTDLYKMAVEQQLLPENFSFTSDAYFGFGEGFITTDEFTPFELKILRAFEWDRINFNSPQKIEKAAKMMNLSISELNEHRKKTRINAGVYY